MNKYTTDMLDSLDMESIIEYVEDNDTPRSKTAIANDKAKEVLEYLKDELRRGAFGDFDFEALKEYMGML